MNEPLPATFGSEPGTVAFADLPGAAAAILDGERDMIANSANLSSLLFHSLEAVNWCGFYFARAGELVLGPFQGRIACVRIPVGRGVCGTAAQQRRTLVVPDVDAFPGHIACDAASRSEIVVPLLDPGNGRLVGVLDIDSPVRNRFDQDEAALLEGLVQLLLAASDPL